FFYLTDGPEQAHWLTADERERVREMVARDCGTGEDHGAGAIRHVIRSPQVWHFAALYFLIVLGNYGVGLWLPQMVKKGFPDYSTTVIGILSALPFLLAAIGMVLVGRHSDRTRERRWHVALPVMAGAAGLTASALVHSPWPALLLLCLAALGNWSAIGPFWAMPTAMLRGTTAAAGIAMINSVGNLAGFAGPYVVGWVKQATGSFTGGLLTLAVSLI